MAPATDHGADQMSLQRHRVTRANNRAPTVVTSKTLGRLKEADPDADLMDQGPAHDPGAAP